MGIGTDGIPTTDNIPETTEKLECPTDNIPETIEIFRNICFISNEYDKIKCFKKSVVGYIVGWKPEYFSCLGHIGYGCGYPTRIHTHTRGNSVAHVCLRYFRYDEYFLKLKRG